MLTFPINKNTFKSSFLDGNGNIEISTDQDTWKTLVDSNGRFTREVQSLAHLKIGGATKPLKFGGDGVNQLSLSVAASAEAVGDIRLIWPGQSDPLIEKYQLKNFLTADRLYAAILFSAKADASVKGSSKLFTGPLQASFGVGAGANVGYERLIHFSSQQTAPQILGEIFGGVRLPQRVTSVPDIPAVGEVLAFRYGGYLNLSASLAWGYSVSGTSDYQGLNLDLALKYSVRLMASASFSYRLAGDFSIEARQGREANWVRFVVRRSRESSTQFAADFGFEAKSELKGLPETPDKLLSALLGTDAKSILQVLAKIEENSSIEGLEQTVGKLAKKFVYDRASDWIGKALNNDTVKEFLGVAHEIVERYQNIDQRIIDLYEDFLDNKLPQLDATLNLLLGVGSREDLKNLTDGAAWDLIRRLWNEKFHDLLLQEDEFQKFSAFVKQIKEFKDGGANKLVRDLIARLKAEFPLDGLLNELAKFDTPAKLKTLADEKLQAFLGRLIGKSFSALSSNDDFKQAIKHVKAISDGIASFRKHYAEAVEKAAHQSFAFKINYLYKQTKAGETLFDLEVNLGTAAGSALAEKALNGDFAEVLRQYNPQLVRISSAKFTQDLSRSAQIGIKVFNWNYKGVVELVQHSEHSIETVDDGLMHLFSIDTSNTQTSEKDWKKLKEKTRRSFALSILGNTFQPTTDPGSAIGEGGEFFIEDLKSITAQYELAYEDDRTKATELTQYLSLGEYLRLIPSAANTVTELQSQFPNGLGKVSVKYVVRYDDTAVRNGLIGAGVEDLRWFGRLASRQLMAAHFTSLKITNERSWMGFVYLDPNVYQKFREIGNPEAFSHLHIQVDLPKWFHGGGKRVLHKDSLFVLAVLYGIEDDFVKSLMKLSDLVKAAGPGKVAEDDLRSAALKFVGMADDLDKWSSPNTFFAVFDRLAQQGVNVGGKRQSALVLEITPPNEKKVTKYLHA